MYPSADALKADRQWQEYDLTLNNDVHTNGHIQWFYFSCQHTGSNGKLNLDNMAKPDSMFNYGMQPCVYSVKPRQLGRARGGVAAAAVGAERIHVGVAAAARAAAKGGHVPAPMFATTA